MTQYGIAERASVGHWPRWLVVHERLPAGTVAPLHNALFALFVVGVLAYGAALAWYTLDRFDLINMIRDGYRDDAFYYFQIAHHMAEGRFSTFDGGITRTNGYHPLWLFLITPFYWAFDKTEALFAIKAFEVMLIAGGVALVAVAARVARLPWILLFAVLPTLCAQDGMLYGLEAALVLFMLGALMLAACLFARGPVRWRWPLAALAFALPWARLECAAVAVAVAAALCLFEWSGRFCRASASPKASASAGGAGRSFLRRHGLFHFGNVYSGTVSGADMHYLFKAAQGSRPRDALQFKLYRNAPPPPRVGLPQADGASWFRDRIVPHLEPQADGIGLLVEGRTAQAFAWDCTADANEVAEWTIGGRVGAVSDWTQTADGLCSSHTLLPHGHLDPVRVRRAPLAEAVAALVGGRPPAIRADSAHQRGFDVYVVEDALVYVKAACEQVDAETPFFLHLVPAGDDFDDGREAHGFNRLDFLLKYHGDWFGESGEGPCLAEAQLPDYGIARIRTGQYMQDPRTNWAGEIHGASWFWERMAPHLEPQGDGVGLLVRGRTAEAFAWDCTADENDMAEWTFGGRVEAVSDWTQRRTGVCSSDILLPDGHLDPVRVRRAPLAEAVAALVGGRPPAIRADSAHQRGFDVYVAEDALVYVKAACEQVDAETSFFLHLVPVGDDFDDGREVHGFNNLDFLLEHYGEWFGEERGVGPCLAEVPLPDYGIAEIRTGQYRMDRHIWSGRARPDLRPTEEAAVRARRALREALASRVGGRSPAIRADAARPRGFDVYLLEDALVYAKERCDRIDVETPFFLHVVPAGDDFDDGREAHGFNNHDFLLERHGDRFGEERGGGPCLVEVPLPDYGIAEIRTGQYRLDDLRRIWEGEVRPDQPTTEGA